LNIICKKRDVLNNLEAQKFFGLTDRIPEFRQPSSAEPMQVAEVQESSFCIVDFAYDSEHGFLLIGASDDSWSSRLDPRLSNMKLPWGSSSSAPAAVSQMTLWKQSPADLHFEVMFCSQYPAYISCVALSVPSDKGFCLCGLGDGSVGFHPVQSDSSFSGNMLPLLKHTGPVMALAFDETDKMVISVSKDSAIMLYDTKRHMTQSEAHIPAAPVSVHYCQTSQRLFTGLVNGRVLIWDISHRHINKLATIPDSPDSVTLPSVLALDYEYSSATMFTGTREGFSLTVVKSSNVGCWGRVVGQCHGITDPPTKLAWAKSSHEVLASFPNGAVCAFDVDKGTSAYALSAHKSEVTQIKWLDAPRRLLTASKDKTLKIWDFPSLQCLSLEEQPLFASGPSSSVHVSTSDHAKQDHLKRSQSSLPVGADPLLGHSFSNSGTTDPLAGGSRQSTSYTSPLPHASLPSNSLSSSLPKRTQSVPETAPTAKSNTFGGKSSLALQDDSDDDLCGWDK